MQVIRHIRLKYACKHCEGVEDDGPTVMIAPLPEQLIPKSNATPGLVAHLTTSKFVDALPFYRQEKILARIGVSITRATMCNWTMKVAEKSKPLIGLLQKELLSGPLIQCDETTLQVMKEPERSNTTKSYMWVFRGGLPNAPVLIYQYHPTRASQVPKDFLCGFEGFVQTDGYAGYDFLDHEAQIFHVGCWAHARRKFMDAWKGVRSLAIKRGKRYAAEDALDFIGQLYRLEKSARKQQLDIEAIFEMRQEKAKPILKKFKSWLLEKSVKILPQSLLGKAIAYTLNQWNRLCNYTESGFTTPDNNLAENAIRPFVVGRKNWLFSGTPKGAEASATMYSLIETAKANNLEPYAYLKYVFAKLIHAKKEEDYKALLLILLT